MNDTAKLIGKVLWVKVIGTLLALAVAGACVHTLVTMELTPRLESGLGMGGLCFGAIAALGTLSLVAVGLQTKTKAKAETEPEGGEPK